MLCLSQLGPSEVHFEIMYMLSIKELAVDAPFRFGDAAAGCTDINNYIPVAVLNLNEDKSEAAEALPPTAPHIFTKKDEDRS